VYADPLLPFLIACAAISALFAGLESTKRYTAQREMAIGRVMALGLFAQLVALVVMLAIAKATGSPWALVAGSVTSAAVLCAGGHLLLPGQSNRFHWDMAVVKSIMQKSKWILLSTPVSFLQSSADVMILGGLVNASLLGNYTIAFMLANVVQQVAGNLSGNVFFPGMSAAGRESPQALKRTYLRFQMVSDAIILTITGGLVAAGPSIVGWLFDKRYTHAGELLSVLAIGLVGLRYHVIEALLQAQGNFKLGSLVGVLRLLTLIAGIYVGFAINGLTGAALGVSLSWFAAWPVHLWCRAKIMAWPWKVECAAVGFLLMGYGLGMVFAKLVVYLPCIHCKP
jgi:O-antigen/teichoic acid export membrane protein